MVCLHVVCGTCFTKQLVDHLSYPSDLSLPRRFVDLRVALATVWGLFEQVQHLLVRHCLLSCLLRWFTDYWCSLILLSLFRFFIRRESFYRSTTRSSNWALQALVQLGCSRNIRADLTAALWLQTGCIFMAKDLEIVLRIDLVGQRQHTASSLWLILLLLVLLWCRRLQREVGYRYIGQVLLSFLHLKTWYLLPIVNLLIRTWSLDTEIILLFDNCSILV